MCGALGAPTATEGGATRIAVAARRVATAHVYGVADLSDGGR